MATPIEGINSLPKANACPTKCPACGTNLTASSPVSLNVAPAALATPEPNIASMNIGAPQPKKGLLGLGFLGLGGRRRARTHRGRRTHRRNTRRHRARKH
jgi:hypothetical protein